MRKLRRVNLDDPETQKFAIYNDGELAFCQDMHDMLSLLPVQLDMYPIVLVVEGKAVVEINGKSFEVRKNDLFTCPPNNIIENGLVSFDFKGCFIFVCKACSASICIILHINCKFSWEEI